MGLVQIIKTQLEFADRCEPTGRCRQSVEDPIPDPEPAAPSLGYPDPEIFHHPPVSMRKRFSTLISNINSPPVLQCCKSAFNINERRDHDRKEYFYD
jgi:hypothetical protein